MSTRKALLRSSLALRGADDRTRERRATTIETALDATLTPIALRERAREVNLVCEIVTGVADTTARTDELAACVRDLVEAALHACGRGDTVHVRIARVGLGLAPSPSVLVSASTESASGTRDVRLVELVLPPAPHEPPAVARLDGEHLLVVGPTARSARVFADMARSVGLVASRAHDLPGLRATSSGPPFDAVLVDGAFPGGLRAVVGATRDWKVRPPLLVAAAGDDDARAALHQGADGILGKPVLPSKLAGALARLIRGHGAPAPRVSSRRALLVEDEPLNARLAERVLRKVGCSVVHAGDGKTALDVLARESFDVVFLDLGLPGLDGIGVARRLRQTEGARRVPIIAVTAAAPDVAAFAAAGIDGYLGKPLHEGAVRQTLERVEAKPASTPSVSLDERAGPTSDGPVLDLAELLCRANGDTAFVAEILADLDAEARGLLAATADAAREGGEALARAAHRLRGALLAVGARHAARLAADVELAARSPGTDAIADRVAALRDAVDAARAAARRQATSSG